MWLTIKLHMHSVYCSPLHTPHSHPLQPTDTHIDLEGEEKSYIRGDMETMGREEATSGNNLSCLRQGAKTKRFGGVGGGTMATVRKKVTAGYHSCTGPRTMPILWLGGAALCTR